MPRALKLKDGTFYSEKDGYVIKGVKGETFHAYEISLERQIPWSLIAEVILLPTKEHLPCSTYSPLSSSPANSPPATTSPTQNTPTTPPHVLLFLQESLASLEAQVGSMRRFLAATFQQ